MSDYLGNIAAKSLNTAPVVQPRPVSLFEPAHAEGMLGGGHRFPGGTIEGLSDLDRIETAEMRSIDVPNTETHGHQPMVNSVMDHPVPLKAPESTPPESSLPRNESDHVPRSIIEFSETITDKESAPISSAARRPQNQSEQQHLLAANPLPNGGEHRHRVQPSIERVAFDLPGLPGDAGLTGMVPVSKGSVTPSLRTIEPMPARSSPGPTIQVTIGRIEVRAATPPVPPQKQRSMPKTMSLDEYLGKYRGGGR